MAEIFSSAVVQETVSQILSRLVQKYEEKEESNTSRNMERLEMANIRLEAALETSEKWKITDGSLLRWRRKLKRAAQECDDTLHKCKHRILEKEQMEHEKEHWDNLHNLGSQWFRPNPLCCKQHGRHELRRVNNLCIAELSDVSLEPVIEFNLQCQVSLPMYSKLKTSQSEGTISLQDSAYLKAGISFAPHGTSEHMLPANRSSVTVAIASGEQRILHMDIALEQLEEIMLPLAIDYFSQNDKATVYQLIWKSKHGSAIIQIEKPILSISRRSIRTRRNFRKPRKRNLFGERDQELVGNPTCMITHLLDLWGAHLPVRLQRSFMDWMQKEKETQIAA